MRYLNGPDTQVLRRMSQGPSFRNVGFQYQASRPLDGLGLVPTTGAGAFATGAAKINPYAAAGGIVGNLIGQKIGGKAGSAVSGVATGAAAGAMFGPIGAGIGAAIGGIASLFGGGANKAQIAKDVAGRKDVFNQYMQIVGSVPGRALGLNALRDIWKGAAHLGHFPSWRGQEQRMDYAIAGCNRCGNTLPQLWAQAATGQPCKNNNSGCGSGNNGRPVQDAKTFVDLYIWPANSQSATTDPWLTNTDSIGRQIIYDVADAFLAERAPQSVPLIGQSLQQAPTPVQALPPPSTPAPVNPPVGGGSSVMPPTASGSSATDITMQPDGSYTTTPRMYAAPVSPFSSAGGARQKAQNVVTAGGSDLFSDPATLLAIVAGLAALSFAMARPQRK